MTLYVQPIYTSPITIYKTEHDYQNDFGHVILYNVILFLF